MLNHGEAENTDTKECLPKKGNRIMKKSTISAKLTVLFFVTLLFSAVFIQQKTLSEPTGKQEGEVKAEESSGEISESDFTDDSYVEHIEYVRDTFESFSKLVTTIVRNSDLKDARKMETDNAFLILGHSQARFSMNTHLNNMDIENIGHLDWECYAIGDRNVLVFMEGYILVKNKKIAELELELLKAKNANASKITEAENNLNTIIKQIQLFKEKYVGWSD